jgi:hypothetical protein
VGSIRPLGKFNSVGTIRNDVLSCCHSNARHCLRSVKVTPVRRSPNVDLSIFYNILTKYVKDAQSKNAHIEHICMHIICALRGPWNRPDVSKILQRSVGSIRPLGKFNSAGAIRIDVLSCWQSNARQCLRSVKVTPVRRSPHIDFSIFHNILTTYVKDARSQNAHIEHNYMHIICALHGPWNRPDVSKILLRAVGSICPLGKFNSLGTIRIDVLSCCQSNARQCRRRSGDAARRSGEAAG